MFVWWLFNKLESAALMLCSRMLTVGTVTLLVYSFDCMIVLFDWLYEDKVSIYADRELTNQVTAKLGGNIMKPKMM